MKNRYCDVASFRPTKDSRLNLPAKRLRKKLGLRKKSTLRKKWELRKRSGLRKMLGLRMKTKSSHTIKEPPSQ